MILINSILKLGSSRKLPCLYKLGIVYWSLAGVVLSRKSRLKLKGEGVVVVLEGIVVLRAVVLAMVGVVLVVTFTVVVVGAVVGAVVEKVVEMGAVVVVVILVLVVISIGCWVGMDCGGKVVGISWGCLEETGCMS